MSLVIANRVFETSTTTGTGPMILDGAQTGFQSFLNKVGNGNTCNYCIEDGIGGWEIGIGMFVITAGQNTLQRTTVSDSSNAGSLVNFQAGTKNIRLTIALDFYTRLIAFTYSAVPKSTLYYDSSGNLQMTAGMTNGQLLIGSTSGSPALGTLTAGSGIGVTNGAGSITIANTGVTSNVAGSGIGVSGATGAVTISNTGVTSAVAGTGITVSGATGAVTITNSGVTSLAGTTNQVSVSGSTGAITLSLPQNIHTGASPTFAAVTATTFTGSLSGTATNATNSAIATNSTNASYYPVFVTASTGNLPDYVNTSFTYNPSTNTLTATTFSGALSGNASTATSATTATTSTNATVSNSTTNSLYYIPLAPSTGSTGLVSNASIQANPSTGLVSATSFSGAGTGLTGTASSLSIGGNAATATSATSATTATNLAGGGGGQIPYQSAGGTTAMLAAGTTGYVLKSNGTSAPSWAANSPVAAGSDTYVQYNNTGSTAGTSGLTFNYSTNVLTATGGFNGTATDASHVDVSSVSANSNYYILGSGSGITTSAQVVANSGISFNPSTATITATTFSGTATNANNSAIATNSTNSTMYPVFVTATTGNLPDYVNTGLTYNPSTSALSTTGPISAASLGGFQFAGFRNRIRNGDFRIQQHVEAAAGTAATATPNFVIDGWYAQSTTAACTVAQVTGSGGEYRALKFTGIASNAGLYFGQRIEAQDIYDLASDTVMLSCQLVASANTTVTWTAYYPTAVDTWPTTTNGNGAPAGTKNSIATGTFSVTTGLQTFSASFNAGANAINGLAIEFSVASLLASATLTIQAVQLEAGSVATPFERLPYSIALQRVQRYSQLGAKAGTGAGAGVLRGGLTLAVAPVIPFDTPMRATPTYVNKATAFSAGVPTSANQCALFDSRLAGYMTISGAFADTTTTTGLGYQQSYTAGTSFSGAAGDFLEVQLYNVPFFVAEL